MPWLKVAPPAVHGLRDGGARLNRRYTLYDLTQARDSDLFEENLQKITE